MQIKVFIVDDHQVFRQGLSELLLKKNNVLIAGGASNGREALDQLKSANPDIIFLDISMPELNGIDACVHIKRVVPKAKIIILSMHDKGKYISDALSQGVCGYLLKDIDAEELFQAIDTVMNGGVFLSGKINQQVIKDYIGRAQDKQFPSPVDTLSVREREVFQLMAEGYTGKEMAKKLNISPKTVEHHRYKVMSKLSCHNTAQVIRLAIKEGVVTP
ncbi:MAG: DNA-binding response regulator [Candidatus Zixiibacteriota bacterium]|nr:MAG: DNA-binding response regulator [candidate division Zixibacteria bacterium]HDL03345.1 response regulator transcription factor [candidate division Zixibacteria bacterium]